jgi:hypothetical protein
MKRINQLGLYMLLLTACNNPEKQAASSVAASAAPATESTTSADAGSCNNLIMFRKGAVLEGASFDAAGKETARQTTTITDVTNVGGITEAHAHITTHTERADKTMDLVYKCDGSNLFMDMNELMQNYTVLKDAKAKVEAIQFPLNMSAGETLPDASFTVSMNRGGKPMDIKTSYKNRTVGPKETIKTPAGSYNCYKINQDIESEMLGMDEKTKKIMDSMKDKMKMKIVMWYAPDFGIVKTEMFMNNELKNYSYVTSVKK